MQYLHIDYEKEKLRRNPDAACADCEGNNNSFSMNSETRADIRLTFLVFLDRLSRSHAS